MSELDNGEVYNLKVAPISPSKKKKHI